MIDVCKGTKILTITILDKGREENKSIRQALSMVQHMDSKLHKTICQKETKQQKSVKIDIRKFNPERICKEHK